MSAYIKSFRERNPSAAEYTDEQIADAVFDTKFAAKGYDRDEFKFTIGVHLPDVADWIREKYSYPQVKKWHGEGKIGFFEGYKRAEKIDFDPTGYFSTMKHLEDADRISKASQVADGADPNDVYQYDYDMENMPIGFHETSDMDYAMLEWENKHAPKFNEGQPVETFEGNLSDIDLLSDPNELNAMVANSEFNKWAAENWGIDDNWHDLERNWQQRKQNYKAKRTEDIAQISKNDQVFLDKELDNLAEESVRGRNIGGSVGEMIPDIGGFVGSVLLTGGAGGSARTSAKTGVKKYLTKKLPSVASTKSGAFAINRTAGLTGALASGTARTAALPTVATDNITDIMEKQHLSAAATGNPEYINDLKAIKDGTLQTIFEYAGEEYGRDLIKIFGKAVPLNKIEPFLPGAVKGSLAKIRSIKDPIERSYTVRQFQKQLRIGSMAEEWLEEDFTAMLNAVAGSGSWGQVTAPYTDLHEAGTRALTLGLMQGAKLPGAAAEGTAKSLYELDEPDTYVNDIQIESMPHVEKNTGQDITPEIDANIEQIETIIAANEQKQVKNLENNIEVSPDTNNSIVSDPEAITQIEGNIGEIEKVLAANGDSVEQAGPETPKLQDTDTVKWHKKPVDGTAASGRNPQSGRYVNIIESENDGFVVTVADDKGFFHAQTNINSIDEAVKIADNLAGNTKLENQATDTKRNNLKIEIERNKPVTEPVRNKPSTMKPVKVKGGILWIPESPDRTDNIQEYFQPVGKMQNHYKNELQNHVIEVTAPDGKKANKVIWAVPAPAELASRLTGHTFVNGSNGIHKQIADPAKDRKIDDRPDNELIEAVKNADTGDKIETAEIDEHDPVYKSIRRLGKFLGVRVVFVKGLHSEKGTDGLFNSNIPGVAFIDVDSKEPELFILGHELYHDIKQYSDYDPAVRAELHALYRAVKAAGIELSENESVIDEQLADVLGSAFTKGKFWKQLSKENDSLFRRVADWFIRFLDKLKITTSADRDLFNKAENPYQLGKAAARLINTWKHRAGFARERGVGSKNYTSKAAEKDSELTYQDAIKAIERKINRKGNRSYIDLLAEKWFKFRKDWSDSNLPLAFIIENQDKIVAASDNPKALADMFQGKASARALHAIFEETTDLWGRKTGESLADVLDPIVRAGKLDEFGAALAAARASILESRSRTVESGFDPDHYLKVLEDMPEMYHKAIKGVTAWSNRMLDVLVESGAITPIEAKKIKKANPIYVPFYRLGRDKGRVRRPHTAGKGYTNAGKAIHKIEGDTADIIDPIEALMIMSEVYFAKAHKAAIARSVANLVVKHDAGMGLMEKIDKKPAVDKIKHRKEASDRLGKIDADIDLENNQSSDILLDLIETSSKEDGGNGHYIINTIVNGQRQWFRVDPDLYECLEGFDARQASFTLNMLGAPSRLLRLGSVGLNAGFSLIRNPIKDSLEYQVNTSNRFWLFGGLLGTGKGLVRDIKHRTGIKHDKDVSHFYGLGGEASSLYMQDKTGNRRGSRTAKARLKHRAGYDMLHPLDMFRSLLSFPEMAPRIDAFSQAKKAAEKNGLDADSADAIVTAFNAAQEATLNFSRAGNKARTVNEVSSFFNASIRGLTKPYEAFRKNPKGFVLRGVLNLTLPTYMLWRLNRDEDWYKNLSIHDKATYWHFKMFGYVWRIPKPYEYGAIFASVPETTWNDRYRQDKQFVEMLEHELELLSPVEIRQSDDPDMLKRLAYMAIGTIGTVTAAAPLIDIVTNRDFANRKLVAPSQKDLPPAMQYKPETTNLMKNIGAFLNISPSLLEHAANSYSGGIYRRIHKYAAPIEQPRDIPVAGTLAQRDPGKPSRQLTLFYRELTELTQKLKSGQITLKQAGKYRRLKSTNKNIRNLLDRVRNTDDYEARQKIYKKMEIILNKVLKLDS